MVAVSTARAARGLPSVAATQKLLVTLRRLCMRIPGVTERVSHGAPTWFAGAMKTSRSFASFCDDHHSDGRVALVCAAFEGVQAAVVADEPDIYYVPPYVGGQGWIGVKLDRVASSDLARIVEQAYEVAIAKTKKTQKTQGRRSVGR